MLQVDQDLDALLDGIVRLLSSDVRDEADAAGVVLTGWVVQALLAGRPYGLRPLVYRGQG